MFTRRFPHLETVALVSFLALAGCAGTDAHRTADLPTYKLASFEQGGPAYEDSAMPVPSQDLAGAHPVDDYLAIALSQNPDIRAARQMVEAARERVIQARSLEDPMLDVSGFPFYPNVPQTAAGRMTAGIMASQKVPWFGKLDIQADAAAAQTNQARAELASVQLQVVEQVKRAYYELYFIQQATRTTEESRQLLEDLAAVADAKYRANTASQQDVLRAELEVSKLDEELIGLRQQRISARARLARLLHVSPDTALDAADDLTTEEIPGDLQRLYERAVAQRPELQAQLAAVQRDRRMVALARKQYYPDMTLKVDWREMSSSQALSAVADGLDDVGIGMSVNLPIYRERLKAGVREAHAQTLSDLRRYDSLRAQTLEEVKDQFAQATSQQEMLELFRDDIIPKAQQTLEVSAQAYRVGDVDFLQLIDNWQQLLQYEIAQYRLEAQLRQSLASLERIVGGTLPDEQSTSAPVPESALETLTPESPQ